MKRQIWPCALCVTAALTLDTIMLHENERHGATHEVKRSKPKKAKKR